MCINGISLSCTLGFAGQGGRCRTCTGKRTNAPINRARHIEVNDSRVQRQSHLTLFKMHLDSGRGQCSTRTHDAPINRAWRIKANGSRIQRQNHLTPVITCGPNINDMIACLCKFVWYAMIWPMPWVSQIVFELAGRGGQCRIRTYERTNALRDHTRHIVEVILMYKNRHSTLYKNRREYSNAARERTNAPMDHVNESRQIILVCKDITIPLISIVSCDYNVPGPER